MIRFCIFGLTLTVTALVAGDNYRMHFHVNDQNCLDCHPDVLQQQVKHFYESSTECIFCHEPAVLEDRDTVMIVPNSNTCRECHAESNQFGYSEPHRHLECYACHNPHSSQYDNLLHISAIPLCSDDCHSTEQLGRSHPIGASVPDRNTGGEMTCISTCHRMHKPNSEYLLVTQSPDLCFSCHGDKF